MDESSLRYSTDLNASLASGVYNYKSNQVIDGSAKLEELDFVVMGDDSEPEEIPVQQIKSFAGSSLKEDADY